MPKFPRPKRPERDRDVFTLLHALRGKETKDLAKRSFLAATTIRKIRVGPSHGGTRYPRHTTMVELARLAGKRWELVDDAPSETARDGGRARRSGSERYATAGAHAG